MKRIEARLGDGDIEEAGRVLALAFPDRLANGRGAQLEEADALASDPFLAIAEVQGSAQHARILLAAPIARENIEEDFARHIVAHDEVRLQPGSDTIKARRIRRLGKVILEEQRIDDPDPERITAALVDLVRNRGHCPVCLDRRTKSGCARGSVIFAPIWESRGRTSPTKRFNPRSTTGSRPILQGPARSPISMRSGSVRHLAACCHGDG
ncbi:hypothetical protein [Breoghania sp.]|uniref:hypothetical protein n=1 Tax=Breoghania sp. TaxID=2065378 RepID=UPI003204E7FF